MELSQLKLNPDNPRLIKDEKFKKLVASIKDFPKMMELRPIIVDDTYTILGGNMRYNALREAGFTEIPDNWVKKAENLTEDEKKQFIIKDNLPFGEWDWDILANNFEIKDLLEWGFDEKDLKIDREVVEDEVPEVSDEPAVSKLGEAYQLGRHRLMCGDSTRIENVEKLMNGQKADMVFTDPPYSVNYEKKNREILKSDGYSHIENDDMNVKDIAKELWKPAFDNMAVLSKDGASIYVTMPQGGDQMMMMMMMMMDSWQVKHELIWVKPSPVFSMGRLDYDYMHEPIVYGWKKNHEFYGGGEFKKSVWMIGRDSDKSHPTMKPVQLMANALKNSSKEGDICMDLFGGSGSTLIACEQTNRICYMMELDPKYCDVIRKRYAKFIDKEDEWQTL